MSNRTEIGRAALGVKVPGQKDEPGDRPMLWAVHAQSKKVMHVSYLSREQTGLKCECVCYACKTPLQAVNAGRDASHFLLPNARGQFFRHASGHQRDECLQSAARMAALHMFLQLEEVDLPAPKATRRVVGISGQVFEHTAPGNRVRARVMGRQWIDEQKAQITLENGKVILVKLISDTSVSEGGVFDAVINIQVNDPDVASWTPEQLLDKIVLVDEWMCWGRHWEDSQLEEQAESQARLLAVESMDLETDEMMALPPGLSSWQKSESLLHNVLKNLLAGIGRIRVPGLVDTVEQRMPDGTLERIAVEIRPTTLVLKDARLECRLGDTVPDVVCTATDQYTGLGTFELMIEVAVTHRVDESKARKIHEAGIACLEVDAGLLNLQKRCTRTELFEALSTDSLNKRWINLPMFRSRLAAAAQQLDRRALVVQARMDLRGRMNSWAEQRSATEIGELYLKAVRRHWASQKTEWGEVKVEHQGLQWSLADLAACLKKKGCPTSDAELMIGHQGVLWCLSQVDQSALLRKPFDMLRTLKFMDQRDDLRPYLGLVAMAAEVYRADRTEHREQIEELLSRARDSLRRGEETYARPDTYDSVIRAAFPALAKCLSVPAGTLNRIRALWREKNQRETAQRQKEQQEQARIFIAQELARVEQEQQRAILQTVDKVAARGWLPRTRMSSSIAQCQSYLRERPPSSWEQRDYQTLVALAHRARDLKVHLKTWLLERKPTSVHDVQQMAIVLREAWLLDEPLHAETKTK